ncbi:YggT family protein [Halomonas sp. FeN2]|jgi:YggT family protein|uniref:YggT family protein n=1 Tax=Vreelandella neptunia TaxID=115551 RepID=A0ABZ0YP49_9GAMM|nr:MULTISPECIES: YggT family protein [Halomonas]TDV97362.1 YggT family protein [Halomonas alkaliantarctica]MBF57057.1 YggT family protein [Halomonas sp.]MBL1269862.1 YggT family protein [Halomonas sp.]MDN3562067.1 YggT family protein [Halomonas neptunia]UBR48363.1 YggT family protein [Halomonas sp. FeN2]|tara:strand:- start:1352 stop:1945 length:594 start_codon:yes stop_codon:yes gene_type:complete
MGNELGSAGLMLVNTLINIYLFLLMLRFLLQASRADYYNPLSQSVVKITQPVVGLFQGFLGPVAGRFDLATLAAGFVLKVVSIIAIFMVIGVGMPPIAGLLIAGVAALANAILKIYFFALIVMIILSWVAPNASHPGALLVMQLVEPIMAPVRKVIPALGMIDLSPIVVFIAINLIDGLVVGSLIRAAGISGALVGL